MRLRTQPNVILRLAFQPIGGVLLNRNPYQLTPRSYSSLSDELLDHSFDRSLRNIQVPRNLLVREPIENASQHLVLAGSQRPRVLHASASAFFGRHERAESELLISPSKSGLSEKTE